MPNVIDTLKTFGTLCITFDWLPIKGMIFLIIWLFYINIPSDYETEIAKFNAKMQNLKLYGFSPSLKSNFKLILFTEGVLQDMKDTYQFFFLFSFQ